uniref:Uncharacterized protein n=1 Tax=viral metagenome TaxID=1070528 RepID=A0A6M3INZ8_9ZZZZ
MKFDPITHKVYITSLNRIGKEAFVYFLKDERKRHDTAVLVCVAHIEVFSSLDTEYNRALTQFYDSEKIRHEEDMAEIDKLLEELDGK